ncbi:fasciclin domain-containing protein [Salisaeta longa]|uniref:fasciclin domain-containing protein n=1 Tax=Salisaeta longa TaxID=503170 RepID=UPI0003B73614|nr:fasciclin domain-containing protein [Salisaeta longa]
MIHQRSTTRGWTALVALFFFAFTLTACDGDDGPVAPPTQGTSIADLLAQTSDLSTLQAAVEAAGLTSTFEADNDSDDGDEEGDDETTYTVFAPNNAAFASVAVDPLLANNNLLTKVLTYHVVEGTVTSDELSDGQTIETLQGAQLIVSIENGTVRINGATVVTPDVEADNGVVHIIDGVLQRHLTITERATITPQVQVLVQAIAAAGLGDDLNGDGPFTVFAPIDDAVNALTVDALLDNTNLLGSILQYHVAAGETTSGELSDGQTITTLQGDELTIAIDGETVRVNGATVVAVDIPSSNGVIHLIDRVLLENRTAYERIRSTDATQTLADAVEDAGLTDTLNDPQATYTVFAPNESAFEGVDLSGLSQQQLQDILTYHVIPDAAVASSQISDGQTAQTVEGSDVTFAVNNDGVFVNDAQVVAPDFGVSNGIVHRIDGVLMPPSMQSAVDVTVTLDNVGASAWEVTSVDGATGVSSGGENPTLTLTVGTRYRFVNNGGGAHPLGFQNSAAEYLLSQADGQTGSLEGDPDINYQEDGEGVTFTYTQALADAVATYRCTVHGSMEGSVNTN